MNSETNINNSFNSKDNSLINKKNNIASKKIYFMFKRLFDILVGIIGILILIPVTIIVKIVNIINKDYGSVFYTQKRVGKDGKIFKLYKYRSMIENADEKLKELLDTNEELAKEWKKNQKLDYDPRITNAGRVLRRTSLDELPQFINLLKGDMSLIGPRPLIPGELDEHNGIHEIYENIKPGITGWWACNGRSATTYEKRLELEYYYCNNCSIWLDFKIFFKTILVVFEKTGAK